MPTAPKAHQPYTWAKIEVFLVIGPPCAGKTTYIKEHAQYGDLILDLDSIYAAVSWRPLKDKPPALLPFVLEAREAIIQRLMSDSEIERAWIIVCAPDRGKVEQLKKRLNAKLITLIPPIDECKKRARLDETRDPGRDQVNWDMLIDFWFAKW